MTSFYLMKPFSSSLVGFYSGRYRGSLKATLRLVPEQATCLRKLSTIDQPAEMLAARGSNIREFMTGWMDEGRHMSEQGMANLSPVA
ncbi:hypothetical protein [Rhizobium subbaraonis]|jgi:hypothetical protein|uniref:hypothetical protein n=1 Tax=Rhizobium subbaraonis TaxID=908946 RepID=UPI0011435D52|nr:MULTISPECIES: hypothetical protein [Hyphomicrobiales]